MWKVAFVEDLRSIVFNPTQPLNSLYTFHKNGHNFFLRSWTEVSFVGCENRLDNIFNHIAEHMTSDKKLSELSIEKKFDRLHRKRPNVIIILSLQNESSLTRAYSRTTRWRVFGTWLMKEQKRLECRHKITTNSNANGEQHHVARTKPSNWPDNERKLIFKSLKAPYQHSGSTQHYLGIWNQSAKQACKDNQPSSYQPRL
jgi:hypothetical protein